MFYYIIAGCEIEHITNEACIMMQGIKDSGGFVA
jgi:hypothetical protein